MQYRFPVLAAAALSLYATSALAAPVFMLQFGSFESRTEAESKLNQLKTKHGGVLAKLETGVREVQLPPDNLTVHRTQAGPMNTRDQAQTVCSQLASNGDECYVVETAMYVPPGAPTTQVAAAAPATPADVNVKAEVAAAAPAPVEQAQVAQAKPIVTSLSPEAPAPVMLTPIPARDSANMAALARMSQPAPAYTAPRPVAVAAASPNIDQALNDAAAAEAKAEVANETQPATKARKESSFWDSLNPWSDDEDEEETEVAEAEVEEEAAEEMQVAAVEPQQVTVRETRQPQPVIIRADQLNPLPQPNAVPMAPISTGPLPLPPPPAPLASRGGEMQVASATPAPVQTNELPAAQKQVVVTETPQPAEQAPGNVNVGEAKRVPLTQAAQPAAAPSPVAAMQQPVQAVSLLPSSTLGQKTLWAHIGQFADAQTALAFWDGFRRAHPDFPVVRVRVSTPYNGITRGKFRVALQVGPFARIESVKNLCATIDGNESTTALRCGSAVDLGVAANPYSNRPGYLQGSRYKR